MFKLLCIWLVLMKLEIFVSLIYIFLKVISGCFYCVSGYFILFLIIKEILFYIITLYIRMCYFMNIKKFFFDCLILFLIFLFR